MIDEDRLVRYAKAALTRPDDFGYHGNLPLFTSWGILPVEQTRDSGALERSNYRRITEDMTRWSPEFTSVVTSSHWAVGWVDQLAVRVLYDAEEDVTPENITGAFMRVMEIFLYLAEQYPVYDSSDFSELESEESREEFESGWADMIRRWDDDEPEPVDDEMEPVYRDLRDNESGFWCDTIAEAVMDYRQLRIDAAKAAVRRILGK